MATTTSPGGARGVDPGTNPSAARDPEPLATMPPYVTTRRLAGVTMDERRRRLPGVRVSAYIVGDNGFTYLRDATSELDGWFAIDDAPPARYILHFQDPTGRHQDQTYPGTGAFEHATGYDVTSFITLVASAPTDAYTASPPLSVAMVPMPLRHLAVVPVDDNSAVAPIAETAAAPTAAAPTATAGAAANVSLSSALAVSAVSAAGCNTTVSTTYNPLPHIKFCRTCPGSSVQLEVTATFGCALDTLHGGVYFEAPDGTVKLLCPMTDTATCTITKTAAGGLHTYTWQISSALPPNIDATIRIWWACATGSGDGEYADTGLTALDAATVEQCDPTGRVTNGLGGPVIDATTYLYVYNGSAPCNATGPDSTWTDLPPAGMAKTALISTQTNSNGDYNLPPGTAACYIVKVMPTTGQPGTFDNCSTVKFSQPVNGSSTSVDFQCP